MKILLDENIPQMTAEALIDLGHDVRSVRGTDDQGTSDNALWKIVQREQRLLITTDKGFATHRNSIHSGLLIVRLRQPNRRRIHDRVMRALARFREPEWQNLLVVMRDRVVSVWRGGQR